MGINQELGNMVKKDKFIAKQTVIKNLKSNPHYYSRLNSLNIDDKDMKIDETTFEKTKKVVDEMVEERKKLVAKASNS